MRPGLYHIFFCLWIFSESLPAQDIHGLRQKYESNNDPPEKTALALALGDHYMYNKMDSAAYFYSSARSLVPTTGFDSLFIKVYEHSSLFNEIQGNNDEAIRHVHIAWARVKQSGRQDDIDQMYILLGRYHMRDLQYDSAIYYWTLLKQSKEEKGETYLKWLPNYYLGDLYADLKDWPTAKSYYDTALACLRLEKRPKDYLYFLYVYMQACDIRGEIDLYSKLKDEYLSFKQETGQNILSPDHSVLKLPNETLEARRKKLMTYLPFYLRNHSKVSICETYFRIGETYMAEQDYDRAIEAYDKMLVYADSLGIPLILYNGHAAMYKAYLSKNDFKNALTHHEILFTMHDSILSLEKQKQFNEMQVKYETAEKEKQLAETTLNLETARKKQQFLSISLIGAVLVSAFAFYAFRIKQKSNRQLEEKNKLITTALQEKDILLREIHHRVKNNLQMISALLYLHGKSVEDSTAQEALMESQNRVQSMAMIHQNLYQAENLLGVSIREYLDKLLQHLINAYNIEADRIRIIKRIGLQQLDVDTVIPLALIINELISNALKYAFRDGRQGEIHIDLGEKDGVLLLEVKDNGMGLPEHFSREISSNFGFKLINILCDRLGASWSMTSKGGTTVSMTIPQKKAA